MERCKLNTKYTYIKCSECNELLEIEPHQYCNQCNEKQGCKAYLDDDVIYSDFVKCDCGNLEYI